MSSQQKKDNSRLRAENVMLRAEVRKLREAAKFFYDFSNANVINPSVRYSPGGLRHANALSTPAPACPDWLEDAGHENGRYSCRCEFCGQGFIGHKRRVVCRVCYQARLSPAPDAPAKEKT